MGLLSLERKNLRYDSYDFGGKVNLVISGSPYPRLIGNASLHEPSPRIPPGVVVIRVGICIRKVPQKEHCFSFCWIWFIVCKSPVWIVCLTKISCKYCSAESTKDKPENKTRRTREELHFFCELVKQKVGYKNRNSMPNTEHKGLWLDKRFAKEQGKGKYEVKIAKFTVLVSLSFSFPLINRSSNPRSKYSLTEFDFQMHNFVFWTF